MAELTVFRQSSPFGCFVTCYGMVRSVLEPEYRFDGSEEFRLMEEAFKFDRECYEPYLLSDLKQRSRINTFLESRYLVNRYEKLSESLEVGLGPQHRLLSCRDFKNAVEQGFAIVLLDQWFLNMATHFPHYVVVEGFEERSFTICDPWPGEKLEVSEERFMESVKSLKNRLNCSPVLFSVE